jgi:hypothetical protein
LENFFGFVRQNPRADDQSTTTCRIIEKTTCACFETHHLHINIIHQGRDNVGGVVIDGEPIDLTDSMELAADQLRHSFVALAGLNLEDTVPPFNREMLRAVLNKWRGSDKHTTRIEPTTWIT